MDQDLYERFKLFSAMTYVDEMGIRRWKMSRDCVDPFDFELAGLKATDKQEDAFLHEQIDAFEKESR